jgi:hypothetical protein
MLPAATVASVSASGAITLSDFSLNAGASVNSSQTFRVAACVSSGLTGQVSGAGYTLNVGCASQMVLEDVESDLQVARTVTGVEVSWSARAGQIDRYKIEGVDGSETCTTEAVSCEFSSLSNGDYSFFVTTFFVDGTKSTSAASPPSYFEWSVPTAPSILRIDAQDSEILIHIVAGKSGERYLTFEAACSDGRNTLTGSSEGSTIVVEGVTAGTEYTCSVIARNSIGDSLASVFDGQIIPEASSQGLPIWLLYQATQ